MDPIEKTKAHETWKTYLVEQEEKWKIQKIKMTPQPPDEGQSSETGVDGTIQVANQFEGSAGSVGNALRRLALLQNPAISAHTPIVPKMQNISLSQFADLGISEQPQPRLVDWHTRLPRIFYTLPSTLQPLARHWYYTMHPTRHERYMSHLAAYMDAYRAYSDSSDGAQTPVDGLEVAARRLVHHVWLRYIECYGAFQGMEEIAVEEEERKGEVEEE